MTMIYAGLEMDDELALSKITDDILAGFRLAYPGIPIPVVHFNVGYPEQKAMIYVCVTDTFMSGWGPARNKINKMIFICESDREAENVADAADRRSDMEHVSVSTSPPSYFHKLWKETGSDYVVGNYFVQIKTQADYPTWYEADAFSC